MWDVHCWRGQPLRAVWLKSCLGNWFSCPPSANVTPRLGVGHTVERFPESSSRCSENGVRHAVAAVAGAICKAALGL